jgi:hypothetical protein
MPNKDDNLDSNIVLGNCCFTCINGKITVDYRSTFSKCEKPLWCDKHDMKVKEISVCNYYEPENNGASISVDRHYRSVNGCSNCKYQRGLRPVLKGPAICRLHGDRIGVGHICDNYDKETVKDEQKTQ